MSMQIYVPAAELRYEHGRIVYNCLLNMQIFMYSCVLRIKLKCPVIINDANKHDSLNCPTYAVVHAYSCFLVF